MLHIQHTYEKSITFNCNHNVLNLRNLKYFKLFIYIILNASIYNVLLYVGIDFTNNKIIKL